MVTFLFTKNNPWQFYNSMILLKYRKEEENRILIQGYIVEALTRYV